MIRNIFRREEPITLGLNEVEKAEIPQALSGEDTALLVEKIFDNIDPRIRQHLVDSNVVLTLAGFKPSTDISVSTADPSEFDEIKNKSEKLNLQLQQVNPDIRIRAFTPTKRRSDGSNIVPINISNLLGYERVSKISNLPGMVPFDRTSGWKGYREWYNKMCDGLEEAQEQGKIPKTEHVIGGIVHGYPDQAILDAADSEYTKREMEDAPISGTGLYQEAEPSFLIYPEHKDDPDIKEYAEQASKILKNFYNSDWHKKVAKSLIPHRHRQ